MCTVSENLRKDVVEYESLNFRMVRACVRASYCNSNLVFRISNFEFYFLDFEFRFLDFQFWIAVSEF